MMERLHLIRSELVLNPDVNPRANLKTDVAGLKAQIVANGFTDPLWVRRVPDGLHFEVIDGSRRVQALDEIFEEGLFEIDRIPVDCFDVTEAQAREMALAANVVRLGLTPGDEAEAFYRLTLAGVEIAAIAAHYALPERRVRQRIAIGALPKPILDALRSGKMTIEAAQAFTLSPSPQHQLKTFNKISKDKQQTLSVHYIRQALTEKGVSSADPRARFVGADDYEEAGGSVTRDLFSDATWFGDEKLLAKLCAAKIEDTAKALKDEGWSFVEVSPESKYHFGSWDTLKPKGKLKLSPEDEEQAVKLRARLEQLDAEIAPLEKRWEDREDLGNDEQTELQAKQDEAEGIESVLAEIEAKPFTAKQMAESGVIIATGSEITILRGLIKPSKSRSVPKAKAGKSTGSGLNDEGGDAAASPDEGAGGADYSEAIRADLAHTAQHLVKLAMITAKPAIAARMGLAARILAAVDRPHDAPFNVSHRASEYTITFSDRQDLALYPFREIDFTGALALLETYTPEQLVQIEAVLAADTFKMGVSNLEARAVFDLIDPDTSADGYSVDGEFLKRLNRQQLEAVIIECGPGAKAPKSAKKGQLVSLALLAATNHGWLPKDLRGPSYTGPGSNAWAEAHAAATADKIAAE